MGLDHLTFDPISGLLKAIDRNPAFKMSGDKDEAKTTSESVMDKFIPRVKAEEEDEPEEEEEAGEEEEEDEEDLVDPAVHIKQGAIGRMQRTGEFKGEYRGNMPRRNPGLLPLYGPLCGAQDLRQTQIDNLHLASTSKKIFSYEFRSYIFS